MRPSLRTRLRLGLAAIAVAVALLSVATVLSLNRLGGAVATILRENYASVVACEQMNEALERQDAGMQFAASGREDIGEPLFESYRRAFSKAFAAEAHNITIPGEGELVGEIEGRYLEYSAAIDRFRTLPKAARAEAYWGDLLPRFTVLKERIQSVLRLNQNSMAAADRAAKALAKRSVQTALGVGAVAVLFTLWFAWWLPRLIVRPLSALTRTAQAIGEGNLDVKADGLNLQELLPLADAFNKMLDRLRAYRESSLGELLAAKDLARATLECMLDPVVVCDKTGGVRLANEEAEAAFGLRAGTAEELRAAGVAAPQAIASARDQVFASGEPVLPRSLSEAMRWPRPNGERYYLVRAAPLRTGPREEPAAIVVAQDVTRFHRIDELKSDMVATVSHQFKTPLTSLRMATHLLLEPGTGPLTESQQELVTTARDDTERLRTMVEDLLDVVRIESEAGGLHRMSIDPFGLLCEIADAHRTVARSKGVAIEVNTPVRPDLVAVDPERLAIALSNLVSNAVRHTPSGSRVVLKCERDGRALKIQVCDPGEGIAAEDLPRIFERGAPATGGTDGQRRHGLGLTIAREIVLQHGGELLVESAPGKGSTFTLLLPMDRGA